MTSTSFLPIARPPWSRLGRQIESTIRKALFDFDLFGEDKKLAIALSGGKDSLTLLYMLHAIVGRGFQEMELCAIHVGGEFSCGAGLPAGFLKHICSELNVSYIEKTSTQKLANLECYSCSRERRKFIFDAAKDFGASTIAFGHHREDSIQTLLMNLLHKGEFAANLAKVPMHHYGVNIIRPLIYVCEKDIIEFAKQAGFARITCQCPVGQNSKRKESERLIEAMEKAFPHARKNLASASLEYGSEKAKTV